MINNDISADQLATFRSVKTESGAVLTVNGNVSAITEFDGSIKLAGGVKSTSAIDKLAEDSVVSLVQGANNAVPKHTLKDTEQITINVVNDEDTNVDLVPGNAIVYVSEKNGKTIAENIIVGNSYPGVTTLTANYYTKGNVIKAEDKGNAMGCIATATNDISKNEWGEWMLESRSNETKTVTLDFGDYGILEDRDDILFRIWSCDAKAEIEFKLIDVQYK